MDPVTAVGLAASIVQLIDATANTIKYLNDVKNAPKERGKIAREATGLLSLLTDLRYRLEDVEPLDPWFNGLRSLGGEGGPIDEFKLVMEDLASKLNPTKRLRKLSIFWPLEKRAVDSFLSRIERFKSLIGLALQKDHFQLSLAIRQDVKYSFESLRLNQDLTNLNQWLAAPDPSQNHESAKRKRQPDTGNWFLGSTEFMDWTTSSDSLLWLHGMPGCGKTILSSTIIQSLLENGDLAPQMIVIYYYFDFKDVSKQSVEGLVGSLLAQLTTRSSEALKLLMSAYIEAQNGQQKPKSNQMKLILYQILRNLKKTLIVIDALDESRDRMEALEVINDMMALRSNNVHLLVTSRKEYDIDEFLTPLVTRQMSLENRLVDADIKLHVEEMLANDSKLNRWPTEVREEIKVALIEGAKGMFRWVECQLESLRKCLKLDALRKALRSLPRNLEDTYERIICNIDEEYQTDAIKVLHWICFSIRPMTLAEMVEVLATDLEGEPSFNPDGRLLDPLSVLSIIPSLINISSSDSKDGIFPARYNNHDPILSERTVGLAHYSVKEFLSSPKIKSASSIRLEITHSVAHATIAKTCLAYFLHFDSPPENDSISIHAAFPLGKYAATYWARHYRAVDANSEEQESVTFLANRLVCSQGHWRTQTIFDNVWHPSLREGNGAFINSQSPLSIASSLGLEKVVQSILDHGADIDERDKFGTCALHEASTRYHEGVIRILLARGSNVNAIDDNLYTPLIAACSPKSWIAEADSGQETVHLLLEGGASCNAQNIKGRTALLEALCSGQDHVVPTLLNYGADVNIEDYELNNPLLQLSKGDLHEQRNGPQTIFLTKLLLDHGANWDRRGKNGKTPLISASEHGEIEMVKMLLTKGVDIDTRSDRGLTAIYLATWNGYEVMVRLLMKHGADCNIPSAKGRTPLNLASDLGYESLVRKFVEGGAHLDVEYQGETALDIAHRKAYEDIAKLLEEAASDRKEATQSVHLD